ncbi:MAG: toxin-antitoxin system YwqK family antitoxin [Epsilonproteobacteria bacterium]|nr:toxin-antitoxin system YwqK family antitoxin [Campylobacterota bacterium]
MKKIAFIALIVALSTTLSAEIKKVYYDHAKKHVKFVRNYKNGKLNGVAKAYYKSGDLKTKTYFVDGKVDGTTYGFYKNGKLKAVIPMRQGKINGVMKEYYDNGQLMSVSSYVMGQPIGNKKSYYRNGNLKAKIHYNDDGLLDGTQKEYYSNGNLKYVVKTDNGKAKSGRIYGIKGDQRKMTIEDFDKMGL